MEDKIIKKCPHCGGLAVLNSNYSWSFKSHFVYVKCNICGAQGKSYFSEDTPDEVGWDNLACNDAINAWNMRYKEDK